jgi:hypothetical protein
VADVTPMLPDEPPPGGGGRGGDGGIVEDERPLPLRGPGADAVPQLGRVVDPDRVRARVTYFLLGLVAAVALTAVSSVFIDDSTKDMIEILKVVFTPIITLAAGATGYYFGGKTLR